MRQAVFQMISPVDGHDVRDDQSQKGSVPTVRMTTDEIIDTMIIDIRPPAYNSIQD
jgi:hypothetical protein